MVEGGFGRAVGAPGRVGASCGARGVEDDAAVGFAEMRERGCDLGGCGLGWEEEGQGGRRTKAMALKKFTS